MRPGINRELVAVMAVMAMAVLSMALLQPILPLYLTSIGVSPATLGLMFSAAMVGMVIGESSGGVLADRVGLKLPMAVGTFLCAPLVLAFVFTRAVTAVFLVFFLWGIVRAAVFGPARGYIGTRVPFSSKASFMAVYATTLAASRGLGALAGGLVADRIGYSWDFYLAAAVAFLGGLLLLATFRTVPMFSSSRTIGAPPASDPGFARGSAGRRLFAFQCAVAVLYFWGSSAMSFLPLLAAQVVGLRATEVGILFTASALVSASLLIPMGRLADRRGRRALMMAGLLVFGVGMAGLAFSRSYLYLLLSVGVQSLGGAMFTPAAVALVSDTVPASRQSSAMGIYGAFEDVGVIAGAALGGLVWTGLGPEAVFLTGTGMAGLGALVTAGLVREPRAKPGGRQ